MCVSKLSDLSLSHSTSTLSPGIKQSVHALMGIGNVHLKISPVYSMIESMASDLLSKSRSSLDLVQFKKYEKRYVHYKTKLMTLIAELEGGGNRTTKIERIDRVEEY